MGKYLAVVLWLAMLAVIAGVAAVLARRQPAAVAAGGARRAGAQPASRHGHRADAGLDLGDAALGAARFAGIAIAGVLIVFGLMCALGVLVVNHGLTIDKPIFTWIGGHQVHAMAALQKRLTKLGDTWTVWGAAFAAAACLTVASKTRRWLPIVVFVTVIVGDHYTTLALRHVFHRLGPPSSPLGTFPSGGCDRVILFYGIIGYLLWREFSGRRQTALWIGAAVAALGFNEAYSRVYLSLHWTTDALSGLLYGVLLLAVFIGAIRFAAGPAVTPTEAESARAVALDRDGAVSGAL